MERKSASISSFISDAVMERKLSVQYISPISNILFFENATTTWHYKVFRPQASFRAPLPVEDEPVIIPHMENVMHELKPLFYFEWEHFKSADGKVKTGDKYAIQPRDCTVTWLCGLYRIEDGYPVFVVLTKEPTAELSKIHDRMPLMLPFHH
ncbi:MAG: SOS response-associated peptidase family protein [Butyrivibrio sp.]|nr:SOS response-associated peptidase family protein [Butyrivibrio sp.]